MCVTEGHYCKSPGLRRDARRTNLTSCWMPSVTPGDWALVTPSVSTSLVTGDSSH